MSYTNGGQTIDKSMNGIISFDTGGGVVIEGDTITASNVITDNITCQTLEVNTASTFAGSATFSVLPTSVIAISTSINDFITRAIANTYYGQLATGITNAWESINTFSVLPTSIITISTSVNDFITRAIANSYYGQLATGVTNAWLSNNTFNSALPTSTITTTTSNTQFITKAIGDALYAGGSLLGSNNVWTGTNAFNTSLPTSTLTGTPTTTQIAPLGMLSNVLAPKASPTFTGTATLPNTTMAGDLTCSFPQKIILGGISNNFIRNTNLDGATATTCNIEIACWNGLGFHDLISGTTKIFYDVRNGLTTTTFLAVTNNMSIAGTNIFSLFGRLTTGFTNTWASDNTFNGTNTIVQSPLSTTTANPTLVVRNTGATRSLRFIANASVGALNPITRVNDSVISVNGGGGLILAVDGATTTGAIRLSTANTVLYGSGVIMLGTNNIAEALVTTATADATFRIRAQGGDNNTIKFIANAVVNALNPITELGDAVISASSVLTLTADGAVETGIRILDTGAINIKGTTITLSPSVNTIMGGAGVIMGGINNVAEALVTTATADPTFRVRGKGADTKTIKFIAFASVNALNPITEDGDGVISADSVLTLTADNATTEVGIRILDTGVINVRGTTTNLSATTNNLAGTTTNVNSTNLVVSTSTATTFVNLPSTTTSFTSATANQFITKNIGDTFYGRLGIANTWSARNTFSSGITVTTDVSCNAINCSSTGKFDNLQVTNGVRCDGCLINPQSTMQIRGFDSTGQYVFTNAGVTTPNFRFGFDYFGTSDRLIIEPLLSTFYNVVKIKSPATTTTATNALVIENTEASPSQINFLLNAVASTANPNVTAGDDVIFSNGGILNLTTSSTTACGIRISQTDIQTKANTSTLTGTTLNNDITTTNVNSTTLAISGSTATTFVNLPSTTTAFTSATANQFITKNIGDTLYADEVTGGYARLSNVANSFTNDNNFNLTLPTSTLTGTPSGTQIAPINMLNNVYGGLSSANAWGNTNTFNGNLPTSTITTTSSTTQIAPIAVLNTLFGQLATGITNTWASTNVFNAVLPTSTITTSTSVSQFITRTIANIYYGQLSTINTWLETQTFNKPITAGYTIVPTRINTQLGFISTSTAVDFNGGTANVVYNTYAITIPASGTWRVDAFVKIYNALSGRFDLSIPATAVGIPISHSDIGRVSAYAFQSSIMREFWMTTSVVYNWDYGQTLGVAMSATANQVAGSPTATYNVRYQLTRLA